MLGKVEVVDRTGPDRWEEIPRRGGEGASIPAIARELDLARQTVRRCLRQTDWKLYQRAARSDTLLATHAEHLRRPAAAVGYSAHVLFQELPGRQGAGLRDGETVRAQSDYSAPRVVAVTDDRDQRLFNMTAPGFTLSAPNAQMAPPRRGS